MTDPNDRWLNASCNHLFPTALFSFQVKNSAELNQQLLQIVYQLKQQDPGHTASNILGWHSRINLFDLPELAFFKQLIDAAIAEVAQAVGYSEVKITPANCWANINPKYASNKIHDHANCLLSGVYYVKTPPNSGNLTFYDPREAKTFYKPKVSAFTAYTGDAVGYAVEAGTLLIFPSWLKHGVDPNLSDDDRVSISFNYVFS